MAPEDQDIDSGATEQTGSGSGGKKTSSQRYRDQRDRAYDMVNNLSHRQDALDQKIDTILTRLTPQEQPKSTDPWDNMSDQELADIIRSEEHADNRALVGQAQIKLNERMVQRANEDMAQKIREESSRTTKHQQELSAWQRKAIQDYGETALDQSSDLFQAASIKYDEYENRYGKETVQSMPKFIYDSIRDAADDLGISRNQAPGKPEGEQFTKVPSQASPRQSMPRDSAEGLSEGHAERASSLKTQVDQGDTKGAFKSIVNQFVQNAMAEGQ